MHLPPRRAALARDNGAAPRGGARALHVMVQRALWRPREQAHTGAAKTAAVAAKDGGGAAKDGGGAAKDGGGAAKDGGDAAKDGGGAAGNAPRCRGGQTPSRTPAGVGGGGV
jgi:hypothetical protein